METTITKKLKEGVKHGDFVKFKRNQIYKNK